MAGMSILLLAGTRSPMMWADHKVGQGESQAQSTATSQPSMRVCRVDRKHATITRIFGEFWGFMVVRDTTNRR